MDDKAEVEQKMLSTSTKMHSCFSVHGEGGCAWQGVHAWPGCMCGVHDQPMLPLVGTLDL